MSDAPEFRPDLTSYRVYVEFLRDEVMSRKTPDLKIKRDRKTVVHVDY